MSSCWNFVEEEISLIVSLPRRPDLQRNTWRNVTLLTLCDKVACCHSKNTVHRDIKLENIVFVSKNGSKKYRSQQEDANEIRLIDFGLTVKHNAETDEPLTERSGTTDYVAPEVLNRRGYSNSCDLWSIGVLTYALLSAIPPFAGNNTEETLELLQSQDVEFPSRDWEDFTDIAKDFIRSLLQKDPRAVEPCVAASREDDTIISAAAADEQGQTIVPPPTHATIQKGIAPSTKAQSTSLSLRRRETCYRYVTTIACY